jgi:hypothetical protein
VGWTLASMGEGRSVYGVLVRKPEGKRPLEDLGVGGSITLRWTLERWGELHSAG